MLPPRSTLARRTLVRLSPRTGLSALPLLALLASMACAGSSAPVPAPAPATAALSITEPRKIEVLFLGHDSEHHNSGKFAPMLAASMQTTRKARAR